jgi:hypothetical protein
MGVRGLGQVYSFANLGSQKIVRRTATIAMAEPKKNGADGKDLRPASVLKWKPIRRKYFRTRREFISKEKPCKKNELGSSPAAAMRPD